MVIRSVVKKCDLNFDKDALNILVVATHELVLDLFERTDAAAARNGRSTIMVKDFYHAAFVVCYQTAKEAATRAGLME